MAYENEHRLRDGAVLVYTRSSGKQQRFQARISIPDTQGYVVRSLKTQSLSEALRRAEDLYDELRFAKKQGLDITATDMRFRNLWQKYYTSHEISLSIYRQRLYKGNANRYFLPFFENYKVSDLSDLNVERYWDWRINFYKKKLEAADPSDPLPPNAAIKPSQKTIEMEAGMLRQVFRWGKRMGFVKREPWIKAPRVQHQKGVIRRPTFTAEEWRKIYEYLRSWVDEPITTKSSKRGGSLHRAGPHALHKFQREMLRNYVLFMANSGLRPNEARQLRWRDLRIDRDDEGNRILVVEVAPTTKTGARTVVCREDAERYTNRIKQISQYTSPDNLVFCDREGNPVDTFNKTFARVLTHLGLLLDSWGDRRTIYSLRHFYCTQTLLNAEADIHFIAKNMGCSISYIEKHYSHVLTLQNAKALSRKRKKKQS